MVLSRRKGKEKGEKSVAKHSQKKKKVSPSGPTNVEKER